MDFTDPRPLTTVKNKRGETFELSWRKWKEPAEADYRFYVVVAKHLKWGEMPFSIWVSKAAFPTEQHALGLVRGEALQEIASRLEEVTGEGRPMYFPAPRHGWTLVT